MDKMIQLAGYIFMCNGKTKPECYRYRVFGLPKGQQEILEQIKPGTKLFLFDFEQKLLYGIYEATSSGELNLERAAFGGRFPAQVKFKIWGDYLPLHENSVKQAIQHGTRKGRFKQELNSQQVDNLISLFRPITSLLPAHMAPLRIEGLFQSPDDLDMALMHQIRAPVVLEPQSARQMSLHPRSFESRASIGRTYPAMDPQDLPTQSDLPVYQPYFHEHSDTPTPDTVQLSYFHGNSVAPTSSPIQQPYVVRHSAGLAQEPVEKPYYVRHSTPHVQDQVQHPFYAQHSATPAQDPVEKPYYVQHSTPHAQDQVQHPYYAQHSASPAQDPVQHPYYAQHSATPAQDPVQQPYYVGYSATVAQDQVQQLYDARHPARPAQYPVQQLYYDGGPAKPAEDPVQEPYFVGHYAAQDPYQRYGAPQHMVSHNPNIEYGSAYYQLPIQGENQPIAWSQNAVEDYNYHHVPSAQTLPSGVAHVPTSGEPVLLGAYNPSDPSLSWGGQGQHYVHR